MFTLPPLPYPYDALEPYIDTETMKIHHDKHHQAYVDNLNKALEAHEDLLKMHGAELLGSLDKVPEAIRMKVRNNLGGVMNHNLFWQVMEPNPSKALRQAQGEVAKAIDKNFGSFNEFKEKFNTTALSHFGSGWVWLIKSGDKLQIIDTPNQDNPLMNLAASSSPLAPVLCLDVWEHAYYLKYQNRRKDYIEAFWNVINWAKVSELHSSPR